MKASGRMRFGVMLVGWAVFLLDFSTKWWVENSSWRNSYTVIDGFFKLHYVKNEGIAFGLFHDFHSQWKPFVLSIMAVIAIAVVLYYIWATPPHQKRIQVALGLLLGGILGNFTDRALHHYVIDFLELHWKHHFTWPTFNLADAAITCGVLLIVYETFLGESEGRLRKDGAVAPKCESQLTK